MVSNYRVIPPISRFILSVKTKHLKILLWLGRYAILMWGYVLQNLIIDQQRLASFCIDFYKLFSYSKGYF